MFLILIVIIINEKLNYKFIQELELLLTTEKTKSKDLATKLYQTQAELNMIKAHDPLLAPLAPSRLNFEATSPVLNKPCKNSQPAAFHR